MNKPYRYHKAERVLREVPDACPMPDAYETPVGFLYDQYKKDLESWYSHAKAGWQLHTIPVADGFAFPVDKDLFQNKDFAVHHYNYGGFGKPDDYGPAAIPIQQPEEEPEWLENVDEIYQLPEVVQAAKAAFEAIDTVNYPFELFYAGVKYGRANQLQPEGEVNHLFELWVLAKNHTLSKTFIEAAIAEGFTITKKK